MYVLDSDEILELIGGVAVVHPTEEDLARHGVYQPDEQTGRVGLADFNFDAWKPRRPPGTWHGPVTYMSLDTDGQITPVAIWFRLQEYD